MQSVPLFGVLGLSMCFLVEHGFHLAISGECRLHWKSNVGVKSEGFQTVHESRRGLVMSRVVKAPA